MNEEWKDKMKSYKEQAKNYVVYNSGIQAGKTSLIKWLKGEAHNTSNVPGGSE